MLIHLNEPSNFRYIYINPETNYVHLLVPFIAGLDVSTDNTCKAEVELKAFFEGGAFKELESYKSTLEFHLSLLKESDAHYKVKKERLTQINTYLDAVVSMRDSYKVIVTRFLSKPSNLYSIQLRPCEQDPVSRVVNPVFTMNRQNDSRGAPLSPLYNKMHEIFPTLTLGKPDPRTALIQEVLQTLPENSSFEVIKHALKSACSEQFKMDIDVESWINNGSKQSITKENVDELMGFGDDAPSEDYIDALLGICAPNLWGMIPGSPFYLGIYGNEAHKAESLSMMTQFYLGVLNVYCRAKGISAKNFGVILDGSSALSQELVKLIANALCLGEIVEPAIIAFFNRHKNDFKLTRELDSADTSAIVQKFQNTYRTVTATKENPHMDDFMFLDTEAQGAQDIFITKKGLICTDASHIIPVTPENQDYLAQIRHEAGLHRDIVTPQEEAVITIDIEPEALIDKLDDIEWERLPVDVIEACRSLPEFNDIRQLLGDVAKGKQDGAQAILESSENKQTLLRTAGKFTDYSGRTFKCTAYEYAYWAKDTHMQRMLERHMDDETKRLMLEKIDAMERIGLSYQQHGVPYQNAHYDMSFVLKNLSEHEFQQLQSMLGKSIKKIQEATIANYKNISFTATEFEHLKNELLNVKCSVWNYMPACLSNFTLLCYISYPIFFILSCFIPSPAQILSKKLEKAFDFHSLITALDTYVTHYVKTNYHQQLEAWMKVGQAQRDVPAHIAQEYCRPDRSFDPLPTFNEQNLPRILAINNYSRTGDRSWFPLASSSSGLGFDFALTRVPWEAVGMAPTRGMCVSWWRMAVLDLAAVRRLDEVRINDLKQSRENLSRPASQLGLVR
jgi:hypothetical protein